MANVSHYSSSDKIEVNLNKYCSKTVSEESHWVWRIENVEEALEPEFIDESLEFSVLVGKSLGGGGGGGGAQLKLTFGLENVKRLSLAEMATMTKLHSKRGRAWLTLSEAREKLREVQARDNASLRRLQKLQERVRRAEARYREIQVRYLPLKQRAVASQAGSYHKCLFCRSGDDSRSSNNGTPPAARLMVSTKRVQIRIRKRAGTGDDFYFDSELEPESEMRGEEGWQISKIIDTSKGELQNFALVDGALRVEIKLTLSQVCEAGDAAEEEEAHGGGDYESSSSIGSFVPELMSAAEEEYSDKMTVTLGCGEAGDEGEEQVALSSCKAVLSARSSTLAGLIQRHPNQTHFKLDNVGSPGTLRILVQYLHTGQLPPEGLSSHLEILELALSATIYGLPELFTYCDDILADYCCMENASYLLCKSREYRLFKSSQAIMEYITIHSGNMIGFDISNSAAPPPAAEVGLVRGEVGANPGIMTSHNYTIDEMITTGVRKEVYPFTWEISNFKQHVRSLHPQPAVFQHTRITGCQFNPEAKWHFSLTGSEKDKRSRFELELKCKCTSGAGPPSSTTANTQDELLDTSNVHFRVGASFGPNRPTTDMIWKGLVRIEDELTSSYLFRKETSQLADANGALILNLQLVVLSINEGAAEASQKAFSACQTLRDFRQSSVDKLERDMESLYKSLPIFSDVTITSKEGHPFFAHWRILGARCPAFKSMFESGMEERRSGIIRLDDIPRNAVDIMLCYIYSGRIAVGSFSTAMDFIDVAYVAEKYDLSELRSYCDDNLVRKCNLTNVRELMAAASTYRLPNAQSAIQNYIRSKCRNPSEYSDLLAGLATSS